MPDNLEVGTTQELKARTPVIILAGGKGTRLHDQTQDLIPKPMVPIGGVPILIHIINLFAHQGFREFFIAGGHKWEMIREYFNENLDMVPEGCSVTVHFTGEETRTGGRIIRFKEMVGNDRMFIATYGDGLADINFNLLIEHHVRMISRFDEPTQRPLVTLTAVNPPSRFGRLRVRDGLCDIFLEKGTDPDGWINAGFYVCDPAVFNMSAGDMTYWEKDILPALALQGRLAAYQHPGEFQMMDTWRDVQYLESVAERGSPFWERFKT